MWNQQPLTIGLGGVQQIALRTDVTFQRHHDFFANRINCRIGDLSEQLLEVVINQPRLVG